MPVSLNDMQLLNKFSEIIFAYILIYFCGSILFFLAVILLSPVYNGHDNLEHTS